MRPTKCPDIPVSLERNTEVFRQHVLRASSTLLIWTGGSTPLLCLEGVPDLPVAPQDEAGLTKTFNCGSISPPHQGETHARHHRSGGNRRQPPPDLRASARAISRQSAIHRARDTAAVMERRRRVHRRRARRPHRAAYPGEHAQGEMDTVRGAPWPGRIDGHAGEVSGVAGMSLTLLAPELRATGEAQRTVTHTGTAIGGAWQPPMPNG